MKSHDITRFSITFFSTLSYSLFLFHSFFPRGGDKDDLKAIVLDMRNNGGGLLQGAVETANLLLPPGILYQTFVR